MARLAINLLGPIQVFLNGEPASGFDSDKVRGLLAYLAVEADRPHRRERLAGLLWPEYPERSARVSLRRALANLRQVIGDRAADPPFLLVSRQTIQFNQHSDYELDASAFVSLVAGERGGGSDVAQLNAAADLYRGGFLEGFSLSDSAAFDEWALTTRESLQRQALRILHQLAGYYEEQEAYQQALPFAYRQVELDPFQESAHQQVIWILARSGQRNEALSHYEQYRQLLEMELGVTPLEQTRAMYEQLREGGLPGPAAATVILRREPRQVKECPYRGLAAFREQDAAFFFGREAFTERLEEAVRRRSLVTVIIGPSGSGKSSTVFSGLLPKLRGHNDWLIVHCRPRGHPFHALAAASLPILEPELPETDQLVETEKLAEALQGGELSLYHVVLRALEKRPGAGRLLLVVDQFEELYTLCPEPQLRRDFLDTVLAAVESGETERRSPFVLLLTLRADFMGQALSHRQFSDAIQESALILGPMNRVELRSTIEKPAEKQGAAFEAGLVARILDDVGEEPGNLPLLEFALTLLWDRLDQGWMTHKAYEEIGRVQGALARYAEEVYGELGAKEKLRARQALIQLVQPGEGTEDTRRVANRFDFGAETWDLIQHLADQRLVVTGLDEGGLETAEVVHEALIRGWDRLRDWMEAARVFRVWQERLRVALRQWEDSDRDEGALLRGMPLVEAENWLGERGEELSAPEREFIQASLAEQSRAAQAELAQQARERALERAALRRLRIIVAVLVAASIMGVTLTVAVLNQSRNASRAAAQNAVIASTAQSASTQAIAQQAIAEAEQARAETEAQARATQQVLAERSAEEAHSLALAASARLALNAGDTDLAIALALEANRVHDPLPQVQQALADAAYAPGTRRRLAEHSNRVYSVDLSPDGRLALSGSLDRSLILWDLEMGAVVRRFAGFRGSVLSAHFLPDGQTAILGVLDGSLRLLDLTSGKEVRRMLLQPPLVGAVMSPDGREALWVTADGEAAIWDLNTGQQTRSFRAPSVDASDHAVTALAFSPDGRRILTGHVDGSLVFWDLESGSILSTGEAGVAAEPAPAIESATITADGLHALTTSADGQVSMWNLDLGSVVHKLDPGQAGEEVYRLAIHPSGKTALLGTMNGTLLEWDLASGLVTRRFTSAPTLAHAGWVSDLAISPDGRTALSGATDGSLLLWDVESGTQVRRLGEGTTLEGNSPVLSLAISPDGDSALTGLENGLIVLWDLESGAEVRRFTHARINVERVRFAPDGRNGMATTIDGLLTLWNLAVGEIIQQIVGRPEVGVRAVVDRDGRVALSSGFLIAEGQPIAPVLWDLETGQELQRLEGAHEAVVFPIAISPDGRLGLSGDSEGLIILWDLESGEEIHRLVGQTGRVSVLSLAISPDGRKALSGGDDSELILWDLETGQEMSRLPVSLNAESLAIGPDSRTGYAGLSDGKLTVWDLESGAAIQSLSGHNGLLWDLAISPDGRSALTGAEDGDVRLWDLASGAEISRLSRPALLSGAGFLPDGRSVLIGAGESLLKWDLESGEVVSRLEGQSGLVFDLAISPDGLLALSSTGDPFLPNDPTSLVLWDLETGQEIRRLAGQDQFLRPNFSPDGRYGIVSSDVGGDFPPLFLWDLHTGEQLNRFLKFSPVDSVAVAAATPDGATILSAYLESQEGHSLRLWDLASGELLGTYFGHEFGLPDLAIGPDGRTAVSASWDHSLILWDIESGEVIRRYSGGLAEVFSVAISPDGRFILSGAGDGGLVLWDLETGEVVRHLVGHEDIINRVAFSPDGRQALTSSDDGSARLWRIDRGLGELIPWVQSNRYVRELNCDERRLYQIAPLCGEVGNLPTGPP